MAAKLRSFSPISFEQDLEKYKGFDKLAGNRKTVYEGILEQGFDSLHFVVEEGETYRHKMLVRLRLKSPLFILGNRTLLCLRLIDGESGETD